MRTTVVTSRTRTAAEDGAPPAPKPGIRLRASLALGLLAFAVFLAALFFPAGTRADEGVTAASTHAARPGEEVRVTISCACFPPCVGHGENRHPEGFESGPCTGGSKAKPPLSFGVSLLSSRRLAAVKRCSPPSCRDPITTLPPNPYRRPYTFLGSARPPAGGNNPETGEFPRYELSFEVPSLPPGRYGYVIWSRGQENGHRGRLNVGVSERAWRLMVKPGQESNPGAQASSAAASRGAIGLLRGLIGLMRSKLQPPG